MNIAQPCWSLGLKCASRDFRYYHKDRTHLVLDKETPLKRVISRKKSPKALLLELPRLGGLHHRYEWGEAA